MTREGPKGSYAAPALEKAFEILELLAKQNSGATISEMSAVLDRSVGELFRIVIVMERHGYLQKSPVTDRYSVAYKLLDLAFSATPAQNVVEAALPEMRALAQDIEQSCHLVVVSGTQGMIVAREENPATRGFALRLGASIDLLNSCSGHILLAMSPPDKAELLIDRLLHERQPPVDVAALQLRLKRVRAEGFDVRRSPVTFGVTDMSYPLFGFDGGLMAALTIPFLELIDGSQKLDATAARLRLGEAAARISDRLGYTRPQLD
ncbi:IclR family transcriptional regulator [Sphingomonas sp. Leaf339]|uniref:IclR family transcriptional regulator n=1 Tax=Sphingomonas sp. Leaf339 TaxID=1736343 RepID=UPI0006F690FF|nr:IclR family transcriptional regulator [Sphingomonas sp. Leaf339]KQU49780.1 IclR family transcriptional regulator [Sphingomonas sp. Leaf339]